MSHNCLKIDLQESSIGANIVRYMMGKPIDSAREALMF